MTVTDNQLNGQADGLSTVQKEQQKEVFEALGRLAGATAGFQSVASSITNHTDRTRADYLKPYPATYREGEKLFKAAAEEEEQREEYGHVFKHRPNDVALAFMAVCREVFGMAPIMIPQESVMQEVPISLTESVSVPMGYARLVPLADARISYGRGRDPFLGIVGTIGITTQKRLHPQARGLCLAVEEYLKHNSIYKGKAITSDMDPRFMDPWTATDASNIVWTRPTDAALRGSLLNLIAYPGRARERGLPIHRTVLFEGEPGNGKSETINIVSQRAVAAGMTSILVTTNLTDAIQQARMYAPAVIFFEDIEQLVNDTTAEKMSKLLEDLDGASSKGHEIMLVATTNFIDDLRQSVRRRMAKIIHFGPFDVDAAERYLGIVLRGQVAPDTNLRAVAESMDGWGNSYISKSVEFAKGLVLDQESPLLTTDALLDAVEVTRPEWEAYEKALKRPEPPKVEDMLLDLIARGAQQGKIPDALIARGYELADEMGIEGRTRVGVDMYYDADDEYQLKRHSKHAAIAVENQDIRLINNDDGEYIGTLQN